MIGVILIAVLNVAMFSWFFYLAAKDPSNVFKRRRPPTGDNNNAPPTGDNNNAPPTGDNNNAPPTGGNAGPTNESGAQPPQG